MRQALEHLIWDLQLFAEDGEPAQETAQPEEVETAQDSQDNAEPEVDSTPQEPAKKIHEMTEDEQLDFIKKNFIDEPEKPKKEEPTAQAEPQAEPQAQEQPTEEPTIEVTIDGEKKQIAQSELINGYLRQSDYTKKTMALADERRQVEALMAAIQVRQQEQAPNEQGKPKTNPLDDEMQAAVARAERDLGIKPGEFNQFDPRHNFALQRAIADAHLYQMTLQREQQQVQAEVQAFAQEVQKDPMAKQISDSFRQYILKMGMESPENGTKAQAVAMAMARYDNGNMTLADTKLLKEHWAYVKGELTKAQKPAATPKPIVQPPKTETPGARSSSSAPHVLDKNKLRSLSRDPDGQLNYLKSLGIFG